MCELVAILFFFRKSEMVTIKAIKCRYIVVIVSSIGMYAINIYKASTYPFLT